MERDQNITTNRRKYINDAKSIKAYQLTKEDDIIITLNVSKSGNTPPKNIIESQGPGLHTKMFS